MNQATAASQTGFSTGLSTGEVETCRRFWRRHKRDPEVFDSAGEPNLECRIDVLPAVRDMSWNDHTA